MIEITKYPFKKLAIFSLFAAGFCFFAGESLAQSDRDKMEVENTKPIDRPNIDHSTDIKDNSLQSNSVQPSVIINREKVQQPVKKEGNISGEGKKLETVPSTLSFNIFLYIVDKFKVN
ncbi:hypothetical protein LV84_01632 [Algoriphagus ratkowskyi]|uniref:Uncharacterized protein n=1 Tax=Algoriphagus ratkowskyi TaxID=57028 RepID=A0A2W7RDC9_9BACT|nr:hypothetical protein [Algoriphagus ratkowskyi]PZX58424.1 hypothetical protein LV84_01632 [Algoriphagus ratkowskyi]TXD77709.1 hypothetical protein ESW18_10065 [Algoriphagus ratkowskyi]